MGSRYDTRASGHVCRDLWLTAPVRDLLRSLDDVYVSKENARFTVTSEGHKIGWVFCGNPTCGRHVSLTDLDDCPNHPVEPKYLKRQTDAKGRTVVEL